MNIFSFLDFSFLNVGNDKEPFAHTSRFSLEQALVN